MRSEGGIDGRWAALGGVFLAIALTLALAPRAEAYVYWANNGGGDGTTIGRANLDGSDANQSFIAGAAGPCGVAATTTHLYWANRALGTIGRANLDGTGVDQSFITGASLPCGVAVDSARVYWMNQGTGAIARANLDGSGASQSFIPGLGLSNCAVAVNATNLFWDNFAGGSGTTIGRASVNGTGVDPSFIGGATGPCGVAVNSANVFWANFGSDAIGRANLDGSGANQAFVGATDPCGVALTSTHLFWANQSTGAIGRAMLNASKVDQALISGADAPCGVAVDAGVPDPVVGESVIVTPISGVTGTKCQGDPGFVTLKVEKAIPIGCEVNTRPGRLRLTSSTGTGGGTQSAQFYDGMFRVKQKSGGKPFTELKLSGALECGKNRLGGANAAKRKGKGRKLWGKGKGKFRSKGKKGAGSVRGTTWLVADRCDNSTLGRVKKGKVRFRDFVRKRTVTLKRGDSYVAKARR